MKTKEQIDEWLKKQDWFDKFVKNVQTYRHGLNYYEYLNTNYSEYVIWCAFNWSSTPEGFYFWDRIHKEYKEWYNSEDSVAPKNLLKTGMIVEYDTGEKRLVLGDGINLIICDKYYLNFESLKDNLISLSGGIIINKIYEGFSNGMTDSLEHMYANPGKVIWKREPEIKELTLQEVADKFNIDVKQLRIKDNE